MEKVRDKFGLVLGFSLFVVGIPALMWWVSGRPFPWVPELYWAAAAIALETPGLALSVWAIVYMKRVGKGNPMDAFGHELAPRTKHLMTAGPYSFSRNPMLLGIYIYYIGVLLWLQAWWPLVVFAVVVVLLTLQVRSEEKRLRSDFGKDYEDYCRKVRRYL